MNIQTYLADLENRIDLIGERRLIDEWRSFIQSDNPDRPVFSPVRQAAPASSLEWPDLTINQAILDSTGETMLLVQLCSVNNTITNPIGHIPMIRANYGTTILPSLFGCRLHLMEPELNTLPAALPLPGGSQAIRRLLDQGIPKLDGGQGGQVLETCQYFVEQLAAYPKLRELVRIYHPDLQGPLDICEVIQGSEIFISFYDEPELMRDFLALVTETYIAFANKYFKLVEPGPEYNFHYGWMHRGKIRISLDSCVNFSPDMYRELILPADRKLLKHYGGIIHSCGKVDHFVEFLPEIGQGYHGFQLSQPELNNMEKVFASTIDQGIRIFGLSPATVNLALEQGRDLHGLVHSPAGASQ